MNIFYLVIFKMCKESKALSNHRKIEKYSLFKSAQKLDQQKIVKCNEKNCKIYIKENTF